MEKLGLRAVLDYVGEPYLPLGMDYPTGEAANEEDVWRS